MSKLELTNLNLPQLMGLERLTSYISPPQQKDFTAHLIYNEDMNTVFFIMKDSATFLHFPIPCDINTDIVGEDVGVSINPDTFFYIFRSYSDEEMRNLKMTIEQAEEDKFWKITVATLTDNISVPNEEMTNDVKDELLSDIKKFAEEKAELSFDLSKVQDKDDFKKGISRAVSFLGSDVKVHNAVSVFCDKLVVNDPRHAFIYTFAVPNGVSSDDYVPLHKTSASIVDYFYNKKIDFNLMISHDGRYCWIDMGNSSGICLNNSLSNVNPPTNEKLSSWKQCNRVCRLSTFKLNESIGFLKGFFSSTDTWKPLIISVGDTGITFEVKNTSSASNACNVRRDVAVTVENPDIKKVTWIISESLSTFLKSCLMKTDTFVDMAWSDDSKAVYLLSGNQEIFLGKIMVKN